MVLCRGPEGCPSFVVLNSRAVFCVGERASGDGAMVAVYRTAVSQNDALRLSSRSVVFVFFGASGSLFVVVRGYIGGVMGCSTMAPVGS